MAPMQPLTNPQRGPGRPRSQIADESIRRAAMELLDGGGYHALTIEGVAALAGVGKATVYRRYRSKQDLLRDVAERFRELELPVPDTGDVREDLQVIVRAGIAFLTGSVWGKVLPALVAEQPEDPDLAAMAHEFWVARKDAVLRVIDRAIDRGELRPDLDRDLVFESIVGPMYFRFLVSEDPLSDDLAERIVDAVLNGVGLRAEPDPAPR